MDEQVQGKIMKGIAGFYYVHVKGAGIFECKAKGIFRKQHIKPLVGDNVYIQILDREKMLGNMESIVERKNQLIRPAVANIDQALIIFAIAQPAPHLNLLDRFLVIMEKQRISVTICLNKSDLTENEDMDRIADIYRGAGYPVLITSAEQKQGLQSLTEILKGKTTTVAGPSGVGKSSLINLLQTNIIMETGQISQKIERGKHTTRHSELIDIDEDTYIIDTPGFSSIELEQIAKEDLGIYYKEFGEYEKNCRFQGCAHRKEPDCGVKQAVEEGNISRQRYENYQMLYEELGKSKKY